MPKLELFQKVKSKVDNTVKFVFLSQEQIIEFSYINKNDDKDIICVPTQTGCRLGCKFCFLSDYKLAVRNLGAEEISSGVRYAIKDLGLLEKEKPNGVLLVSYMGCGEPLCNLGEVIESCVKIRDEYAGKYAVVRFGVASLIPNLNAMRDLIKLVDINQLPLKFHLSLHSPDEKTRTVIAPAARDITRSVALVEFFMRRTSNSAEMHYALIDGINDRDEDLRGLVTLLKGRGIPIKFLVYNVKPSLAFKRSKKIKKFRSTLEKEGIKTEYYHPPGWDIGSSCGQFLMDYYAKFNTKKGP